jgi:hypothetical protein
MCTYKFGFSAQNWNDQAVFDENQAAFYTENADFPLIQ